MTSDRNKNKQETVALRMSGLGGNLALVGIPNVLYFLGMEYLRCCKFTPNHSVKTMKTHGLFYKMWTLLLIDYSRHLICRGTKMGP